MKETVYNPNHQEKQNPTGWKKIGKWFGVDKLMKIMNRIT